MSKQPDELQKSIMYFTNSFTDCGTPYESEKDERLRPLVKAAQSYRQILPLLQELVEAQEGKPPFGETCACGCVDMDRIKLITSTITKIAAIMEGDE